MPIRVKSKAAPGGGGDREPSPMSYGPGYAEVPDIADDDSFREVIKKLSVLVNMVVVRHESPH
jgi:hypothetical protein